MQINRLDIEEGTVRYVDEHVKPTVDVSLDSLKMVLLNLNNARKQEKALPSQLDLQAVSIGSGRLSAKGDLNILKQIPDFDISLTFEEVDLPALNDFLKVYAGVDAEAGVFNLYSEMAASDAQLEGYLKPIMTDIKIFSLQSDKDQPFRLLWEGVVGLLSELFVNQKCDLFASKVPLKGNIGESSVEVLPALWNIFRNAFIEALEKETDNEINFDQLTKDLSWQEQTLIDRALPLTSGPNKLLYAPT
ncbi:MAG: DUF748 domain-containing protein [Bacteroidetes bacterium]|nr:DUF748 domain-containing protein [Bacteroidota bacterium]